MANQSANGTEPYTPPDTLPRPPRAEAASFPLRAIVLGLLAAVGLGGALFVASQLVYVYIVYNCVIGIALGTVISSSIASVRYRGRPLLVFLTAVCAIAAYLTFNGALMTYVLSKNPGRSIGFMAFMKLRAENESFMGGFSIGAIGNCIVWTIEFLITWYYAWARVSSETARHGYRDRAHGGDGIRRRSLCQRL